MKLLRLLTLAALLGTSLPAAYVGYNPNSKLLEDSLRVSPGKYFTVAAGATFTWENGAVFNGDASAFRSAIGAASVGSNGTVTQVGLQLPGALFGVSNSPVTGAGTLTGYLQTQAANRVWAGPASGSNEVPSFRALVVDDIPSLPYEPAISAGTTSQYLRGDKTWQTLDKSAVGLPNVDNTSDINKPISTATQTALNAKADTSHTHSLSQITQSGAADGQAAIWDQSLNGGLGSWRPGAVPASFAQLGGIPEDNAALAAALAEKQDLPAAPAELTGAEMSRGVPFVRYFKSISTNDVVLTDEAGTPEEGSGQTTTLYADGTARPVAIPSSFSEARGQNITSFTIPANGAVTITRQYLDGGWLIYGDPVRITDLAAGTVAGVDLMEIEQAGVRKKTTVTDLVALASGSGNRLLLKGGSTTNIINGVSTEATALTGTLPGGTLGTDNGIVFRLHGSMTQNAGGPLNLTIRVKYGATTVFADDVSIAASASPRMWSIDGYLCADADSTSAQRLFIRTQVGSTASPTTGYGDITSASALGHGGGTATEDSTADQTFSVTLQYAGYTSGTLTLSFLSGHATPL